MEPAGVEPACPALLFPSRASDPRRPRVRASHPLGVLWRLVHYQLTGRYPALYMLAESNGSRGAIYRCRELPDTCTTWRRDSNRLVGHPFR
jgi:hypothetical protein